MRPWVSKDSGPAFRARQGALASFRVAGRGVAGAWLGGRNMRFHAAAAWGALWWGWWVGLAPGEMAAVVLAAALVLFAELANTAVEAAVDLVHPDPHPLARAAKDYAAGAVLVAAAGAALTGLLVFLPRLAELPALVGRLAAGPQPAFLLYLAGQAVLLGAWAVTFRPPASAGGEKGRTP